MKIKALLIDFGGVLYDIDPNRAIKAFAKLATPNSKFNSLSAVNYETLPFLADYETGKISTDRFRDNMAALLGIKPKYAIDAAWNATLLGIKSKIDFIVEELAADYPIFLLSNTNELHHQCFAEECDAILKQFKRCYFSYQIKMQKPNTEIFKYVAKEMRYKPEEILFIDDMTPNLDAAASLGFNVHKISDDGDKIYSLYDYLQTLKSK